MKGLVAFLVLLAAAKIGYQEYLVRTATNEVIVHAYRERAIAACQRDAKGLALISAGVWSRPDGIRLLIGKGNLDVYFWQVDHALWNARFKNPYLVLSTGSGRGTTFCEFDIVHNAASVYRL